jgi:hypothetical protein
MVHQMHESFLNASDKTLDMHVPCPCQACQKHREYAKTHPEQHNANMRAYYFRHHEAILLRKAYQRYVSGRTKKLYKTTTQRLIDAGFDMPQTTSLNTLNDLGVPTVPMSSFTAGIEVS